MLKNRSSRSLQFLPTATVAAVAVMSLRPSPNYRGGRTQWHSRGFSNRPCAPVTDNDHSDANREFRSDYNPSLPRSHVRPNSDPRSNQNQSFHPRGQPPPPYSNPYQQFAPPPLYNQNRQFRRQGQPQPHFNPNHRFRPPPLQNQRQQQPNGEQNQEFRPPPYQQFAPRRPFGQFRPQQRFRQPSKPVSDYRNWEHAKPGPPPSFERFTVLSYNILADYLATNHRSKLYFHIPRHILDWEFRRRNIMFELGLWSADILCFQEVDRFQDLEDDLKIRGYNGIWKMRTGEPVDGCAIFWRSSRFKLLHEDAIEFNKFGLRDNVAQICVLQLLNEKGPNGSPLPISSEGHNKVVVCNIHVLYNPKRGEIKLGQVRMLLHKAYDVSKLWDDAPVVLCGDFNSTPKSSLYNFISEQKLDVSELPRDKISGQYSADIRPKRMFTSTVRTQLSDKTTQSPKRIDETNIMNDATHEDEKSTPQLEAKEESEGNDVNCTSDIYENISLDAITNDNSNELLESIGDVSVGEDSTSFLTELHGLDGADLADVDMADGDEISEPEVLEGSLTTDGEPYVENHNHSYDPSGWTPMEIEAATGSSECTTMEHPLKLRSTYTEAEDYSGTRDSNGEPQVTSYHRGFQGTVDYIWRSEGLQTVRVLAPIPKQAMEWTPGFPTKRWGSDHVALVAELVFNKDVNQEKSEVQ